MRSYHLAQRIETLGNDVHHTSPVLIRLPSGEFAHIKDVEIVNGEIVIVATLDAREIE